MLIALVWFVVLAALAAWSMCVWLLHSIALWSATGAGSLVARSKQIDGLALPNWVSVWVPPDLMLALKSTVSTVLPFAESAIGTLPAVAAWLSPLAWIVWGFGALLLMAIGALVHVAVNMMKKRARR
jgi:hypothetical protein